LGDLTPRLAFDLSLYAVIGPECVGSADVRSVALAAAYGGATVVQLRYKDEPRERLIDEGREVVAALRPLRIPVIVNDDADAAVTIDADGAHVGQGDISPGEARSILGAERILGLSITDPSQLHEVDPAVVDYLGVGPVFPTATKADAAPALGVDALSMICAATRLPVVAIGGIDTASARWVIHAGADGIAVVSALCSASDPRSAAESLARAVSEARGAGS
jgi:thiamine-phosphate pyrophosphorylase